MITRLIDFAVIAARQLLRKRARLLLTALGIAIGVAAVVGIISLGEGIRAQSVSMIEEQSDLTLIEVTADQRDGVIIPLTQAKMDAIAGLENVETTAAVTRDAYATGRQTYLNIMGIRPDEMDAVFEPVYQSGNSFENGSSEVVLGYDIADKLRRYEGIRQGDDFNAVIRQYDESGMPDDSTLPLRVAGVLQDRDDPLDSAVIMSIETVQAQHDGREIYDAVYVRVDKPENVFHVADEIGQLGLVAHGSFEEIESVNSLMDVVILVLSSFTGISLIVGALMIINTMVISVFERTREIGISMAVGASQRDIIVLILIECLYIGLIGGILGDLLGVLFSAVINTAGKAFVIARLGDTFSLFASGDITLVTPSVLLLGMAIALILSLISGLYPAFRAAHLDPVEAIRHG